MERETPGQRPQPNYGHPQALNESTQEWLLLDIADASDPVVCSDMLKDPRLELPAQLRQKILRLATP